MSDEHIQCVNRLKGISFLMESAAIATTGDEIEYTKEALLFLSESMSDAIKNLEKIINTKDK